MNGVCLAEVKRHLFLNGARIEPGAFLVGATLSNNSPKGYYTFLHNKRCKATH